ncbi:hypothetical protein ACFE04_021781 [Oxalis oulophora]
MEAATSSGFVEINTVSAVLFVIIASCFLVLLYKFMSLRFIEILVVLFCIGGVEVYDDPTEGQKLQDVTGEQEVPDEHNFQLSALGWCIGWAQAYFHMLDDIIDNSRARNGQPCWFRVYKGENECSVSLACEPWLMLICASCCNLLSVNPEMVAQLENVGLSLVGRDETGQCMEIIELPSHPYFVGVQFHPEFKSRLGKPSATFLGIFLAT